jgi:hypothetical protein
MVKSFEQLAKEVHPDLTAEIAFDCTPLLIQYKNKEWCHPEIEQLAQFNDTCDNVGTWDENVHRVIITNDKTSDIACVIVKSKFLDWYWEQHTYNDDNDSMVTPFTTFEEEKIKDHLATTIEITLLEDTWMPGGKQFCFTRFGKHLGKVFNCGWHFTFSPDVGLEKQEIGCYSYST